MNVVDSSAWLEYFADGPNAGHFAPAILAEEQLLVPALAVLEVYERVLVQRGEDAALEAIAVMAHGTSVALDAALAVVAARISVERRLALADSVIYATALAHDATLWTQDADFASIPGVRYVARRGGEGAA